ncbi:hypothetical protein CONCODRAFT_70459 [Conidiobolus coronatus NRRL 28638]|uniref:Uncharacterized protein n=1 Tax=Conidiobolus coronatus (strain ATCC 28846 / CBS 209.66 / NRRL 28638) TaxID=796925 RepID=A0A137P6M4_CONC2|nr:hypothetical protein CONCODRAFT_70459 [Conidiobolus coronatus NRRL 28638]|eukprot:KXN70663.1 hypothetical protein CONCODRAFT_70459 [Conidiobolus coronatus NRRL 28638]
MNIIKGKLSIDGLPDEIAYLFSPRSPISEDESNYKISQHSDYYEQTENYRGCKGNCEELCVCWSSDYPEPKPELIDLAKDVLKKALKNNSTDVTKLLISETSSECPYQYHFNFIIMNHFRNIKFLFLEFGSNISDELNTCFEQFHSLKTLIMRHSVVISSDKKDHDFYLLFPQSLINLKITDCKLYKKPITVEANARDREAYLSRGTQLTIIPQKLPKLKNLVLDDIRNNKEVLQQFIQLNPKLEFVGSCNSNFTPRTFEIISNLPSLKYEFKTEFNRDELKGVFSI